MGETSNANLLTTGSIPKKIIMFAIPLLWGNLFQQLYNVADSLIVGNFLGNNALAAVSSSGNLIFLMVGFFGGIGVGAGVVIARYFGAGEYEKLKKAIEENVGIDYGRAKTYTVGNWLEVWYENYAKIKMRPST